MASALLDAEDADAREFALWLRDPIQRRESDRHWREACLSFVDRLAAATAGAADGETNPERTANATKLICALPIDFGRLRRDEGLIEDIAQQFGIMKRVPNFFLTFGRAARRGSASVLIEWFKREVPDAAKDIGYVLRLGPELLAMALRTAEAELGEKA